MSLLVASVSPGSWPEGFGSCPLADLPLPGPYLAALLHWGVHDTAPWFAVTSWGNRPWDDWINKAAWETEARAALVGAFKELAERTSEVAIWYAGFHDDVPLAGDPAEFARLLDEQLASHKLEPAARFAR